MRRAALVCVGAVALLAALSGCMGVETTQDKSARLAREAEGAVKDQKGLAIARINPDVKVESSTVLQDANGVAAVVRLRNTGSTQVKLPVAIQVLDRGGRKLYANDIPGLDPSLVSVPVLARGEEAYWVNNQILASARVARVKAQVGTTRAAAPRGGRLPRMALSGVRLGRDADGLYAKGTIRNTSSVAQRRLVITCVARAGARVRAAGRAVIDKLAPAAESGKPMHFTVFFIGDPRGARLSCSAPPTVLATGASQ